MLLEEAQVKRAVGGSEPVVPDSEELLHGVPQEILGHFIHENEPPLQVDLADGTAFDAGFNRVDIRSHAIPAHLTFNSFRWRTNRPVSTRTR